MNLSEILHPWVKRLWPWALLIRQLGTITSLTLFDEEIFLFVKCIFSTLEMLQQVFNHFSATHQNCWTHLFLTRNAEHIGFIHKMWLFCQPLKSKCKINCSHFKPLYVIFNTNRQGQEKFLPTCLITAYVAISVSVVQPSGDKREWLPPPPQSSPRPSFRKR